MKNRDNTRHFHVNEKSSNDVSEHRANYLYKYTDFVSECV